MNERTRGSFQWTAQRQEAALLVAEGQMTRTQIARQVGVSLACLDRWKTRPEFSARVAELLEAGRAAFHERAIADRSSRIQTLEARWHQMIRLMQARAWEHRHVPGGDTGLLDKRVRLVRLWGARAGEPGKYHEVVEYVFDAALMRELRETEKQAAVEMGQWKAGPDPRPSGLSAALEKVLDEIGQEMGMSLVDPSDVPPPDSPPFRPFLSYNSDDDPNA